MNTIIIQPGEPATPLKNREGFSAAAKLYFAPNFQLISLNSHININSRHKSIFVDARTLSDPIATLLDEIDITPTPRIAVIDTQIFSLAHAVQIIQAIKQSYSDVFIGVCGPFATDYPEEARRLGPVDFVLSGDPEPILKQYLDFLDLPQRLAKSKGLQLPDHPIQPPAFIEDLSSVVAMPGWPANFWSSYQSETDHKLHCTADLQITRGNTGFPPDRAFPGDGEPLRMYDFRMLSSVMERCSAVSVNHVNISDPPGIWNSELLIGWCNSLADFHVRQSWGFQLLPTSLSHKEHAAMYESWCKQVDFIFPSCDPDVLEKYGVHLDLNALKATILKLKAHRITPTIRYWIGGPEASENEAELICKTIRSLGYCDFLLQPFPLHHSSPLYKEYGQNVPSTPTPEDYMAWANDPEHIERPLPFWGGTEQAKKIEQTAMAVLRKINRSPGRMIKRFREQLTHTSWVEKLETKFGSIDVIGPPTRDP